MEVTKRAQEETWKFTKVRGLHYGLWAISALLLFLYVEFNWNQPHSPFFTYCLWLFFCYNSRMLTWKTLWQSGPAEKNLPVWPCNEKLANPWFEVTQSQTWSTIFGFSVVKVCHDEPPHLCLTKNILFFFYQLFLKCFLGCNYFLLCMKEIILLSFVLFFCC